MAQNRIKPRQGPMGDHRYCSSIGVQCWGKCFAHVPLDLCAAVFIDQHMSVTSWSLLWSLGLLRFSVFHLRMRTWCRGQRWCPWNRLESHFLFCVFCCPLHVHDIPIDVLRDLSSRCLAPLLFSLNSFSNSFCNIDLGRAFKWRFFFSFLYEADVYIDMVWPKSLHHHGNESSPAASFRMYSCYKENQIHNLINQNLISSKTTCDANAGLCLMMSAVIYEAWYVFVKVERHPRSVAFDQTSHAEVTRNPLIVCSEQFKSVKHVHKLFLFLPASLARGKLTTGCYVRVPHGCRHENLQEIHQWVCRCPHRAHRLTLWGDTKATFI